jgi:hypothetical protein
MDRTVCYNEVCTSGSKCLKAAEPMLMMKTDKDAHPQPHTNKTWSVLKQRFLETGRQLLQKLQQDWH